MRNKGYNASLRALMLRALLILAASLLVTACSDSDDDSDKADNGQKKLAATVKTTTVKSQDIDVYGEFPGRVRGKQTAKIIGRVTGFLETKNYTEGSIVHKGDLLFKIDPKQYQAVVDQSEAQLARARAALADSTRVWRRTHRLYKSNAVSQAERDRALAAYQGDKAAVKEAKANLHAARINLGYTTVKAPITGVTSLRDVDLGSLIKANQTQLTTITQLDPVYVQFALPEDDAFARQKILSEMGKETSDSSTREATIILNNGEDYPHKAKIDFTQSTIDPNTGTVRLRAILNNPDNTLMPGRYVRARLRIKTLDDAIAIPASALSTGQRTEVFVVRDGKVKAVSVELGPDTDKGQVITEGLKPGDEIVVSGISSLSGGDPVKVENDHQDDDDDDDDDSQDDDGQDDNAKAESSQESDQDSDDSSQHNS